MGFENDMLFLSDHAQTKQGNDTIFSCYARYLNAVEAGADAVNGTIGALLLDDGMLAMNTVVIEEIKQAEMIEICLLYTSPSPRDVEESRMPSSA